MKDAAQNEPMTSGSFSRNGAVFRPSATVSRIGLMESCMCRCHGGPPQLADPPPHVMYGWGARPLRWLSLLVVARVFCSKCKFEHPKKGRFKKFVSCFHMNKKRSDRHGKFSLLSPGQKENTVSKWPHSSLCPPRPSYCENIMFSWLLLKQNKSQSKVMISRLFHPLKPVIIGISKTLEGRAEGACLKDFLSSWEQQKQEKSAKVSNNLFLVNLSWEKYRRLFYFPICPVLVWAQIHAANLCFPKQVIKTWTPHD